MTAPALSWCRHGHRHHQVPARYRHSHAQLAGETLRFAWSAHKWQLAYRAPGRSCSAPLRGQPVRASVGVPVGWPVWSAPGLPVTVKSAAISAGPAPADVEDAGRPGKPAFPPVTGSGRSSCSRRVEGMTCNGHYPHGRPAAERASQKAAGGHVQTFRARDYRRRRSGRCDRNIRVHSATPQT